MKPESKQAVSHFLDSAGAQFQTFLDHLDPDCYEAAVALIDQTRAHGGRIHVTGIGKPGHVSGYVSSLLSSTGTPTYFLHGTEAVHGSCGQLVEGDTVIAISNSGETAELMATVTAIRNNGCSIIGVTGNPDSWLAKHSDIHLFAGVREEGGPMNRAPRNSILVEILTLQALSVALQSECGQTPAEYVRRHPGGALGQLREGETAT
ncbi:MAG: SIS domain-containing protein [Pseudoflavonifractor sp.]|nr:SIS domain-containing protein [Pseudoflavonifractor sp.]